MTLRFTQGKLWSADVSIAGLNHYDVDVSTDNRMTWSPVVASVTQTCQVSET